MLIDTATGEPVAQRVLSPVNGSYPFSFTGVRAGSYYLLSGSDLNNNQRITDSGEAVGGYPSIAELTVIQVRSNVAGLQFVTGFNQWPLLWPAHASLEVAVVP